MNRPLVIRLATASVITLCVTAAITSYVLSAGRVSQAVAAEQRAEDRPPRTITKTVTETKTVTKAVFGESALFGAYAAGQIQAGGYQDSAGNTTYVISDQTCSEAYSATTRTMPSSLPPLDRSSFMDVCLTDINVTAKQDPGH
jgi:hypothetical protein